MAEQFGHLVDALGPAAALEKIGQADTRLRGSGQTVAQVVEDYIERRTGIRPDTREEYRAILRNDIKPTSLGRTKVSNLRRLDVEKWINAQEGKASGLTNCQDLWIGVFQATSVAVCWPPSEGGGGVMSVGRSRSLPLWKTAPARTRATRCGALTDRQRAWAASISL